ncbi:hypothetical protein [Curtobacterium sp. VKM Ac-1393]|uniref:hypothetical protein n=1 Tax=Curtobacterium sp. VKM Ac-1393 TaxID=2783814 RepID=UPI00188CD90C|nr:hypothetical protein [Curtobacterium sp. VKM Ac-1393]MBF4609484.1 hypothetical protein [Curtobacterium sp. VKM Ac-1393]
MLFGDLGGLVRSLLHTPRTRKRSFAVATLGALALIGSLLVTTPAHALNDTGTGGVFVPSTGRVLDTAKGTGGFSTPMEAGKYRTIKVAGLAGLPDDGSVGAVSLNATVGSSTGAGTLFGRPDADSGRTTMLIYNGVSGEYTSNSATVAVGSDGSIQVMTETSARLILDVQGYYTANTDGTAAGGFVPVAKRIVDTRSGTGASKAVIAPGKSIDVQVTGANGVPTGASGAVVNLVAINSTDADGYLTPYATGATKPANSLHYAPSESTSIQAQVPLSASGQFTIANSSTTTNLIVDLQGYFTAAGQGGAVFTPSYGRAYDSRASGNTALAENETRSIQIAGTAGVPVMGSGISAVVLTLIVAHGGSNGYADAWADGATKPNTTAINFQTDEIQTNTITVPIGKNGKISLRNAAKATNYVVDVQGWYADPATPTISCDQPYSDGAWGVAASANPINCSASFPAASETGQTASVSVDDEPVADDPTLLSETTRTAIKFTVDAVGGEHVINADVLDSTGEPVASSSYRFVVGDWAKSSMVGLPDPSTAVALTPVLAVATEGDAASVLPEDAARVYTLSTQPDLGNPIVVSEPLRDSFTVPEGLLESGQTYYWAAQITAPTSYSGATASVNTPIWSFTTDKALQEQDPTAGEDSDASTDQGVTYTPSGVTSGAMVSRQVVYGPCTLKVPYPHTRKSGNWGTVGVKPITTCSPRAVLNYDHTTMYYTYAYLWTLAADTTNDSSHGARISQHIQTNVVVPCNGKKKTWWLGQTTSQITYGRAYYAVASSVHRHLDCGA